MSPIFFKCRCIDDGKFGTPEILEIILIRRPGKLFLISLPRNVLYLSSDGHPGLGGLGCICHKNRLIR